MKPIWKQICKGGVILMAFGLAACASTPQPFEYHDDRDEKPGPGLFSGEEGGLMMPGGRGAKTPDTENESAVKQ
jgi:hypothetical protein